MEEEREDVLTLVDEDGNEHLFSVIDLITVENKEYVILLPFEEGEDIDGNADEAIIFRVIQDEEGQALLAVEDEKEWETVAIAWEDKMNEMDEEDNDIED